MLGKLIKHEFKSTGRNILLLIIVLAVVTPLTAAYIRAYNNQFFSDNIIIFRMFMIMSITIYVFSVVACVAATYIILLYRFYKSMISREAYLTHTLPVKKTSLLASKLIVASVWQLVTYVVAILSVGIFTYILGLWNFKELIGLFEKIVLLLRNHEINILSIILLGIILIINPITKFSQIFAAFSVGQRMNGHPILGTVIAFFTYTFAVQIVVSIGTSILYAIGSAGGFDWISTLSEAIVINIAFVGAIIIDVATFALTYGVGVYMFKKKLNV